MKLVRKSKSLSKLVLNKDSAQRKDIWFSYEDVVVAVDFNKQKVLIEKNLKSKTSENHIIQALASVRSEINNQLGATFKEVFVYNLAA